MIPTGNSTSIIVRTTARAHGTHIMTSTSPIVIAQPTTTNVTAGQPRKGELTSSRLAGIVVGGFVGGLVVVAILSMSLYYALKSRPESMTRLSRFFWKGVFRPSGIRASAKSDPRSIYSEECWTTMIDCSRTQESSPVRSSSTRYRDSRVFQHEIPDDHSSHFSSSSFSAIRRALGQILHAIEDVRMRVSPRENTTSDPTQGATSTTSERCRDWARRTVHNVSPVRRTSRSHQPRFSEHTDRRSVHQRPPTSRASANLGLIALSETGNSIPDVDIVLIHGE